MSSQAAAFTGSIPHHYDQGLGPIIFVDYADEMARRVAASAPARVLETAAGTGIVTRRLRDLLPADVELTATDLNPPMLDIARTKFSPGEAVLFRSADAMALPFADGSFDAAVCQFGLMFFPDKPKGYVEIHRVLARGGHYWFSVGDAHRFNPYARIAHEVVGAFFPANPPQFYQVPFSCDRIDPVRDGLIDAGFADIDIAIVPLLKTIPEAEPFARAAIYGNPLIDQIRERGGVDPEAIVAKLVEAFHREFGADPGQMPLQAILFSAKRRG